MQFYSGKPPKTTTLHTSLLTSFGILKIIFCFVLLRILSSSKERLFPTSAFTEEHCQQKYDKESSYVQTVGSSLLPHWAEVDYET